MLDENGEPSESLVNDWAIHQDHAGAPEDDDPESLTGDDYPDELEEAE